MLGVSRELEAGYCGDPVVEPGLVDAALPAPDVFVIGAHRDFEPRGRGRPDPLRDRNPAVRTRGGVHMPVHGEETGCVDDPVEPDLKRRRHGRLDRDRPVKGRVLIAPGHAHLVGPGGDRGFADPFGEDPVCSVPILPQGDQGRHGAAMPVAHFVSEHSARVKGDGRARDVRGREGDRLRGRPAVDAAREPVLRSLGVEVGHGAAKGPGRIGPELVQGPPVAVEVPDLDLEVGSGDGLTRPGIDGPSGKGDMLIGGPWKRPGLRAPQGDLRRDAVGDAHAHEVGNARRIAPAPGRAEP